MKLKFVLLATGALAISFLSAGAANGLWSSPALRQHAMDGLKSAFGLTYGQMGSGKLVTYAVQKGSLSPNRSAPAQTLLAQAADMKGAHPVAQALQSKAPVSPANVNAVPATRHSDRIQTAQAHLPVSPWTGFEPQMPPEPPAPPAVPEPAQMASSGHEPHSKVTVALEISQASKAAMMSMRAQVAAQSDLQIARSDRAAADDVRAHAQAEIQMARELLAVAERISASITKGDYSQISVNYDGPNRCGRPDLSPGCAPLTDEDKARIRAEVRKNLEAARADLRRAVVAFQRQTRANLPEELHKARAG